MLDAELDDDRGRIRYEVEILSAADRMQHKVIIDANNGNVVASISIATDSPPHGIRADIPPHQRVDE